MVAIDVGVVSFRTEKGNDGAFRARQFAFCNQRIEGAQGFDNVGTARGVINRARAGCGKCAQPSEFLAPDEGPFQFAHRIFHDALTSGCPHACRL